ncbi:Oxysterol-binding protein-related protein 11-like protein [Leptotrombidium deliense]|uniref:Oxysterol-binding protein-related protein 11-like protein n=1 Tax=Leptotrombidium deliense TaxID=299467 RepID=A0A443SNM3_9ACAR|nr:Oxysterol-binding protein-related protein 11-like protein [Leptotrombidium deliense]
MNTPHTSLPESTVANKIFRESSERHLSETKTLLGICVLHSKLFSRFLIKYKSQQEISQDMSDGKANDGDREEKLSDCGRMANNQWAASGEEDVIQGQLYKYTNVMKGWQYRWFTLSTTRGTLEYYMVHI